MTSEADAANELMRLAKYVAHILSALDIVNETGVQSRRFSEVV